MEDLDLPRTFFNAIVSNDVLEHVHNPKQMLLLAIDLLMAGGFVLAIVPDVESVVARIQDYSGQLWDPPCYLYGFTRRTIKKPIEATVGAAWKKLLQNSYRVEGYVEDTVNLENNLARYHWIVLTGVYNVYDVYRALKEKHRELDSGKVLMVIEYTGKRFTSNEINCWKTGWKYFD